MTPSLLPGLALTCVAGLLAGTCMLPMKFAKRWAWENTWLVFTIVSLLVLPCALALIILGDVFNIYSSLPLTAFAAPLLFGAGWGVAQALFGLSIGRLGMALTYAIIVGLGALLGAVVPLVVKNSGVTGTSRGALILSGIVVMAAGIVLSSWAGKIREGPKSGNESGSYGWAIATAIICGVLAPMLNYSFAFGQSLADEAVRQGASRAASVYAIWPVALLGGSIPNIAYATFLLRRNATWKTFLVAPANGAFSGWLMAFLWMGAMAIYGVASVYLGPLGTSIGWALFQIFMIITANASGILAGEWSGAPVMAKRILGTGLLLLGLATALIAAGGR